MLRNSGGSSSSLYPGAGETGSEQFISCRGGNRHPHRKCHQTVTAITHQNGVKTQRYLKNKNNLFFALFLDSKSETCYEK